MKVDDQIPEYLLKRWEEERIERESFEDREFLGWEDPGADCFDRSPEHIDRLTDVMEAEDTSSYWEEGRVW